MARGAWAARQEERCFDVWRDYLQLARLVAEMGRPGPGPEAAEAGGCAFCRHNGESRSIYASHRLKDAQGRVQCPVLRQYTCPQCGAAGDAAHTRRFCPLTRQGYTSVYSSGSRNAAGGRKKAAPAGARAPEPGGQARGGARSLAAGAHSPPPAAAQSIATGPPVLPSPRGTSRHSLHFS